MQLQAAVDYYHEGLTDPIAAETDDFMRRELKARGLYFGERPLCTVLRPHFYLEQDWATLKQQTEILLGAFQRAHEACMFDARLRAQLALEAYEEQLFSLDFGGVTPWTSSRLDSFFIAEKGALRYVEYNAETPAGMGYEDVLSKTFLELEPMKRFQQKYRVIRMSLLDTLLESLMRAYKAWGGKEAPQIAIVDWQNVPTHNEHEICRQFFERNGLRAVMCDPRSLEYRGGHLYLRDFRVDMIYKRVLYSEMVQTMGIDNTIVRAVRDHAVFITNSMSCKLMAKKASFAFLSDERNSYLFTGPQLAAIAAHIPWTRVVSERKTVMEAQIIDLIPYITEHRDQFVLKPNDEYGGKGVIIGWECSDDEWNDGLRTAQTTPYVVQERVQSVKRPFPAWIDGHLDISNRYVDADPYVFDGKTVYGSLTRLSSLTLLNVTAGAGSVVPSFIIAPLQ